MRQKLDVLLNGRHSKIEARKHKKVKQSQRRKRRRLTKQNTISDIE